MFSRNQILILSMLSIVSATYADETSLDQTAPKELVLLDNSAKEIAQIPSTPQKVNKKSYLPNKRMSLMEFDELNAWLEDARTGTDHTLTLKLIDHALQKRPNSTVVQSLLLERADLLHTMGRFKDAQQTYDKFYALYPRCAQSERALFRAIECAKGQILDTEHDQTQTHETIRLADAFLECEIFTQFRDDVKKIRAFCYDQLFAYESRICRFHLFQNNFVSADTRLSTMAETFKEKPVTNFDTQLVALADEIKQAKEAAGIIIIAPVQATAPATLVAEAPKAESTSSTPGNTTIAQQETPKKSFVDRF